MNQQPKSTSAYRPTILFDRSTRGDIERVIRFLASASQSNRSKSLDSESIDESALSVVGERPAIF